MTITTAEVGMAAGAAEGVTAGVTAVTEATKECQRRRGDQCQDVSANGRQCYGNDIDVSDDIGGDVCSGGDEKSSQHTYYTNNILQHLHTDSRSPKSLLNTENHRDSHEEEGPYLLVPPEGGWGWVVALGTFMITTLLPMVGPCFGVLFSEYLTSAGSSSTTTAWIFNLQCFLWNTSGLFARPLTQEFGWRRLGLTGCTMAAAGLMVSAFTPSPYFLFFSFSFLSGIGGGLVTTQCFTILPHYFERRRGLANGIMMSGVCMGQLMGPPVARYLQASFGFRGATLILGAIELNACVGASFFHPPEWHLKKVPLEDEPEEDTPVVVTTTKAVAPPDLSRGLVSSHSKASFHGSVADGEFDGSFLMRERLLGRLRVRTTSTSSSKWSSMNNSVLSLASSLEIGSVAALPIEDEPEEEEEEELVKDILPVRVMKSMVRDLGVLKSFRAIALCVCGMMSINGFLNFMMMVPFAMVQAGFTLDASAWCISIFAGCNMTTRFIVSALSDWPRFNTRIVYSCGYAVLALSAFAFTFLSSVKWLMVAMAGYGLGIGATVGLFNIIIIDVMGVENLAPVFGTACFFIAIGFITIGPFIGFIRDMTQSYTISMQITGAMMVVGLASSLLIGLGEKMDRRREEGKTLTETMQKT